MTLFDRTSQGLVLAPAGRHLIEHANSMLASAHRFLLTAEGQTQAIDGTVRITASDVVATYVLPPLIRDLRQQEPNIQVEIVASDDTGNLLQREADIAVRMYQPTQLDVITKKVGYLDVGMYASHTYVEAFGEPASVDDFARHQIIGEDTRTAIVEGFAENGVAVSREDFGVRCDDQVVAWELCKAGCGIGFIQQQIGNAEALVVPLLGGQVLGSIPVWLTAHAELRTSARIAYVYDFIAERFPVDHRGLHPSE